MAREKKEAATNAIRGYTEYTVKENKEKGERKMEEDCAKGRKRGDSWSRMFVSFLGLCILGNRKKIP